MPLYEYACPKGHEFVKILKVVNYDDPQICQCGLVGKRQISAPMITPSFEDYESPATGQAITTKKKRIEDMARSECVPYETGMREETDRKVRDEELKLDKAVDQTMESALSSFPARKMELLEQEIKSGADLSYDRSVVNE